MQTSPTTILRRIMALPPPPVAAVSHLGVDDFALRRGRNYGTLLVDLLRHQVIDLLADRKAETAKAWMQAHPEIKLVSRDRGGDYATVASQGAPQAIQTADRFHLCKNLVEAAVKALARCRAEIRASRDQPAQNQLKSSRLRPRSLPGFQPMASPTRRTKPSGMIAISKWWHCGSKEPKSKRSQNG